MAVWVHYMDLDNAMKKQWYFETYTNVAELAESQSFTCDHNITQTMVLHAIII